MLTNATVSLRPARVGTGVFLPYTGFVVIVAMLFGGSAGQAWSDAVVQLAALPLLAWALLKLAPSHLGRGGQWAIGLLCATVALLLLQLIPMPPSLWSALPGRGQIATAYEAAGMTLPWLPISLDPLATWRCLVSLIPAIAVFLAMLSIDSKGRLAILVVIFIVVFISVPLDWLQLVGGVHSPLRFYSFANWERAVGFFANSNHNAAFLYCAIPFAAALAIHLVRDPHHRHRPAVGLIVALLAAIMMGLAFTYSRAGMALGLVAGLSCVALAGPLSAGKSRRTILRVVAGGSLLALLIAFQFGFVSLSQRVEGQGLTDLRWSAAAITLQAASANLPLGTGFGTFIPVYEMFAPRALLSEWYVNHAHNDWLELALEGGVPALAIILLFLYWFTIACIRIWRKPDVSDRALDRVLARAASIVIILLLIHSALDFPLRAITMMTIFAISCALMIDAAWPKPARGLASGGIEGSASSGPRERPQILRV